MGLEHSAHMKEPNIYKWLCRAWEKFGLGVHAIYGATPGDGQELQSIRFNAEQFTTDQAQKWLDDNGYVPLRFEAAEKSR